MSRVRTRFSARTPIAAVALGLSLAAAACGQKAGVEAPAGSYVGVDGMPVEGAVPGTAADGTVPDPGAGAVPGASAGGSGATVPGVGGGSAGGGGTAAGGKSGGGTAGGTTGGGSGSGGGGASGGDTTGVTATTIKIGFHAPVTGAAAIPSTSFQRGIQVYFDDVNKRGGFHGRKVEVFFEDDQFRPDVAVSRCRDLAETKKVFMIFGGAGSDQIEACARYAATARVPYLSAGVHQASNNGSLGDLRTYYAATLTYEQQAPIVARIAAELAKSAGKKITLRVADNSSLDGYFAAQGSALKSAAGASYLDPGSAGRVPKNTQGGDALDVGTKICNSGAGIVVWNASPSSLLNVSASMPCTVVFVGPGLSNGLNIVANAGCPKLNNARFLSPFPGMDVMRKNSAFMKAYAARNGGSAPDDIAASVYASEALIGQVLQATGKDLSRESFLATMARQRVFKTGIFPPTNFRSRFGGTAMWHLRADCGKREYVTEGLVAP